MEFENSRTRENLETALAGESQNITVYRQLKKYTRSLDREAAGQFEAMQQAEKANALRWFQVLNDGPVHGSVASLQEAARASEEEWARLYEEYADTARQEGFDDLADQFLQAAANRQASVAARSQWLEKAHGETRTGQ